MKKQGYTLVELVISIAILATIMIAVSSIFFTALKNYRSESQKSTFQKELNFAIDNMAKDVKEATSVPQTYDIYNLSSTVLILALPTEDLNHNFVYDGSTLEKDYLIYYFADGKLKRDTVASPLGSRETKDEDLLMNVSSVNFSYSPGLTDAGQVTISVTESVNVGRTVTLNETRTANLRNKQ